MSSTEMNQETEKVICGCGATSSETHQDTCAYNPEFASLVWKKLGK